MMLDFRHPLKDFFAPAPFFHPGQQLFSRSLPPCHQLHEDDHQYKLSIPLPGMRPDDLKISVNGGILSVQGETHNAHDCLTASFRLRLPQDIDLERTIATAADGVLSVTMPKQTLMAHQLVVASRNDVLPAVTEDDYLVTLVVPGMRPSDLTLSCECGVLHVEGESMIGDQRITASHRERLPRDANFEEATAAAENGILTIHLPKRAYPKSLELLIGEPVAQAEKQTEGTMKDVASAETEEAYVACSA